MPQNIGRGYLYLLVFTAGFTTLGVELSASRLLDPWFGNSLIVWAVLIGLILLYLAAGYWLGGRIADRSPRLTTLLRLVAVGAFGVGLVPVVSRPVLTLATQGLADFNAVLLGGSMAAILALFALPVTLLGCVSPFAIRLALRDVAGSGALAGRISALSTAGSILGSFLPVLLLIPNIGTRRTFATLAISLLLVVLIGFLRARRPWEGLLVLVALSFVAGLAFLPTGPVKPAAGLLFETESAFNYIQVIDAGTERQLRLNEGEGIHSVYRPAGGLADGIWDYFLLAPAFNPAPYTPAQVQRIAIIGLAAGTMSKLFTEAYGPIPIDGAELDPAILVAGRAWFEMNEPNLNAVAADGRWFLANSRWQMTDGKGSLANGNTQYAIRSTPYALIAIDAYRPPYIPFHLTTVEFFALARERLAEDGVVAVNVGRTRTDYSLVDAIAATMGQVFPSVYVMDEPSGDSSLGNTLVVATKRPSTRADFQANLLAFDHPLLAEVARCAAPQAAVAAPPPTAPIFTDDRAPVEQVVHALVLRQMLGSR
ncbi:MAG: fused MFS/spermidine synthase [Chloroflexi bacterium]|nr:fused MFS/spermidine synthase [Chloroflexota bacterium]